MAKGGETLARARESCHGVYRVNVTARTKGKDQGGKWSKRKISFVYKETRRRSIINTPIDRRRHAESLLRKEFETEIIEAWNLEIRF